MKVKGISVIIPNYNGRLLLEQILPSLIEALEFISVDNEIIVVDDHSTDDSVDYLRHFFPAVVVSGNPVNAGFSVCINKGIFVASHSHLLLLNSDVKLEQDYFVPLLRYFDKPDTFGVMGRMIGWENEEIQDGGKYPVFHGAKIKTSGNYEPLAPTSGSWLFSFYLSGANALVDKEKILCLQGFDEIFSPFYIEDVELSLRAWRLGWKCYYEHAAVCRHKTSSTVRSTQKKKAVAVIYNRNKMFLHAIHLSGARKVFWYGQLLVEFFIRLFTLRWSFVRSLYLFVLSKNKVARSRSTFLALAKNSPENITLREVIQNVRHSLSQQHLRMF